MESMTFDIEKLEEIKKKLSALKPQKKRVFVVREAIQFLKKEIEALFAKNYSSDEVSAILAREGISISSGTLRTYLREKKKTNKGNKQNKKCEEDVRKKPSLGQESENPISEYL